MADEEVKPDPASSPNPSPDPNPVAEREANPNPNPNPNPNQVKVAAEREAGLVRRCRELEEEVPSNTIVTILWLYLLCRELEEEVQTANSLYTHAYCSPLTTLY